MDQLDRNVVNYDERFNALMTDRKKLIRKKRCLLVTGILCILSFPLVRFILLPVVLAIFVPLFYLFLYVVLHITGGWELYNSSGSRFTLQYYVNTVAEFVGTFGSELTSNPKLIVLFILLATSGVFLLFAYVSTRRKERMLTAEISALITSSQMKNTDQVAHNGFAGNKNLITKNS